MTMRMAILSPNVVFKARVAQASFTYPLAQVTFDTVTVGSFSSIEIGQTVIFGSTEGSDDLGRQRVRGATSTVLKFGRSSQGGHDGEVNLSDNAYIEIWEDYRVWAKAQFIDTDTGEVFKDWDIAYSDQTDESPPVANAGADTAGTINSGTGVLRVQLPGVADNSFPTADSTAIASHQWTLPSGVALVSGYNLTDAVIQVDCDPGFHHIKHSVTDDNGKQHAAYVKVFARDPDDDDSITDFQIDNHRIAQSGQQLSVRVLADIPASTYPDGTAVLIWEGEPSSVTDRSHMRFTGWHHTDASQLLSERTGVTRGVTLDLVDVCGKLATLPGFDQSVEHNAAPSTWLEMKDANMDKYYHYLLHWHSTALVVADFTWSNQGSLFPFVVLGSPEQNLFGQVETRARSFVPNHVFVCNTKGQMSIRPDPMLQQTADRTTTIQATLTSANFNSLDYVHQRSPRFHWLREEAILTSNTQIAPIFSIAPGDAPGQGANPIPHGEQLARSQDDLNECAGHRYRRINAPETPFTIGLVSSKGGSDFGIEPAAMTWVKLTISANEATQRGLTFTEARGLPLEMNISYQYERSGLVRITSLLWERETAGDTGGVTYTLPTAPPPPPTQPPPYDPEEPPSTAGDGFGTNYVLGDDTLVRTRSLSAASPEWAGISGSATGTFLDWILDPWSDQTRGWLLTSDGIWEYADLETATPTVTQILDNATIQSDTGRGSSRLWRKIEASINQQDYIGVLVGTDGSGTSFNRLYYAYSTDAGSTWSYTLLDDTSGGGGVLRPAGGLAIVPHTVSGSLKIQAAVYRGETFVGEDIYIYQSTNAGANWSQIKDLNYGSDPNGAITLIIPYDNNPTGQIAWAAFSNTGGTTKQIYKTTDGWSTFSVITLPSTADGDHTTLVKRLGIEIYVGDVNQVAIWNNESRLFKATDGSTFSEVSYSGYVPGTHGAVVAAGGFPFNGSQYYIFTANRYVFVSTDGGSTWTDKSGDIRDYITSNITYPGGGYDAVIVPVWTAES